LAEKLYEGMFLLDSARFATDPDGMTKTLTGLIEKAGGVIDSHRPWQDGRLAYEINGQRKGLHYLVYFRMPGKNTAEFDRTCRLNDAILRYILITHPHALYDHMVESLNAGHVSEPEEVAPRGDFGDRGDRRGGGRGRRDREDFDDFR
jgi:small subunit ribosomal protein S6